MDRLVASLQEFVDVHNPWDDVRFAPEFEKLAREDRVSVRDARLHEINHELGRSNASAISMCDGLIAALDGVDVDSGTAAEIGYAAALGKRIIGLRTDFRLAGDNPGAIVNLQVQYFIESSGGLIVSSPEALVTTVLAFAEEEPVTMNT